MASHSTASRATTAGVGVGVGVGRRARNARARGLAPARRTLQQRGKGAGLHHAQRGVRPLQQRRGLHHLEGAGHGRPQRGVVAARAGQKVAQGEGVNVEPAEDAEEVVAQEPGGGWGGDGGAGGRH